ncbi:MAG: AAA family ATPase [Deltaproteobacteria bacterium]|nr:AAA family ATPase [Deltaproteobacteria bacterium]
MKESGFVYSVRLERDRVPSFDAYPFSIPAIRSLDELELDPKITFFIGDNGAGKSTLVEAIAVCVGFNAEGGTRNFNFATRRSESRLVDYLRVARGPRRERRGYFLRAESYFNVATEIERLDADPSAGPRVIDGFGGVPLHEQSHGESFLALAKNKLAGEGLFILDEPEAALSPQRQLAMLAVLHAAISDGAQFIIATHSPILMAYPGALLYQVDATGLHPIAYEDTQHFQITRDFLTNRDSFLKHLLSRDEPEARPPARSRSRSRRRGPEG